MRARQATVAVLLFLSIIGLAVGVFSLSFTNFATPMDQDLLGIQAKSRRVDSESLRNAFSVAAGGYGTTSASILENPNGGIPV